MDDFDDFVKAETLGLFRAAYLLTGSKADAEDLTQEALLRIHKAWQRVARADNPRSYARKILINGYLSDQRRPRVDTVQLVTDLPLLDRADLADRLSNQDAVRAALSRLPARQRTAVVLRYYLDLSDREIGEAMNINPSSARSTLARALSALQHLLSRQESKR